MQTVRRKEALLLLGGVLAVGLLALAWTLGTASSEAQEDAMQNCPQAGKWAISVWSGDDGTDTGDALATCGAGAVDFAYYIDPDTQAWLRWFAGRPEVSNLLTLNDMQGVIAQGAAGAPAPAPTPAPTPTPIVFQKSDFSPWDLVHAVHYSKHFHLDTGSFELAWEVECLPPTWLPDQTAIEVRSVADGSHETVCGQAVDGSDTGSKVCQSDPGDFQLKVTMPIPACSDSWDWRVTITPL